MLDTKSKSLIVIEDIDCSLDLTSQRSKKKGKDEEEEEEQDQIEKKTKKEREERYSKVTLSGLLNSIDGLWSACSGEKIIVFTTNFVEKPDPAQMRRERKDKHINMSYCQFKAFKVLAQNYLDVESHDLFGEIKRLITRGEIKRLITSSADVAENLMPKSDDEDGNTYLKRLVSALEEAKGESRTTREEESRGRRRRRRRRRRRKLRKKKRRRK